MYMPFYSNYAVVLHSKGTYTPLFLILSPCVVKLDVLLKRWNLCRQRPGIHTAEIVINVCAFSLAISLRAFSVQILKAVDLYGALLWSSIVLGSLSRLVYISCEH